MKLSGPWKTISRARQSRQQMTLPERLLRQALRRQQTGLRFRRQHPAGSYVLDFCCDAAKLCVEVDGNQHELTVDQDQARNRWLQGQGVRTIRISARDVLNDFEAVVRWILTEANAPSAGLRPPPPPEGEESKKFCESNA